jgi:predicted house-cleaning NTP pyrophosphatase (Maf/HAM1 superfamily)
MLRGKVQACDAFQAAGCQRQLVVNSLAVLPACTLAVGAVLLQIHFQAIPEASIDALIAEGEVFWCAGGLMVEHALVAPHVTRMDGTLDSVMGLAKHLLLRLLCQAAAEAPAS